MSMFSTILRLSFISIIIFLWSCSATEPYFSKAQNENFHTIPKDDISYEIFFTGDIAPSSNSAAPNSILKHIESSLVKGSKNQAVVLLGNTLPGIEVEEDAQIFLDFQNGIGQQLKALREKSKKVYFVPGNNEWFNGKDYTVHEIENAESFLESFADDKNRFVPSDGCGEPKIVELEDDLIIIFIDSQWLMQGNSSKDRKKSGCEIDDNIEFISYLKDQLGRNKRKNIILATHHPVFANGTTAGNFPAANHLLPLPIVGSLITGIRKLAVGEQKFGHPDYEAYRSTMLTALSNCDGCITLSAHEKSLEYHLENNNHFIVSGSGEESKYARKGDGAEFVYSKKGFSKIIHTSQHELWLEVYAESDKGIELVYQKMLHKRLEQDFEDKTIFKELDQLPESVTTKASEIYGKKRFLRGNFYREAWSQEIEAPVIILDETYGGLKPVQQGGGFQTKSLRLQNEKGQQWVLRSINKDVEKVVPQPLRGTFAQNLIQDGIAASHPYGAFVIPYLAEVAGVYHANPKFVYLPHQKALGEYDADFANGLYLFEERPGGNTSEFEDYDNTEKTVNTLKLLDNIAKNHKHVVDQKSVLRARMFDIWLGDWDRHDDQWRWGTYEVDNKTIYRPIPRDRDQVFFKNDGVLDYLASRPFFNPGLRKFDHKVDFYPGLIFNARHFDRTFMNGLTKKEFVDMAAELQSKMTDEVIESAFKNWPQSIQDLDSEEIIAKLKSRRSDWTKYAEMHYDHIYKEITIAGTKSKNEFYIETLPNDLMQIRVYHEKIDDRHKIYEYTADGRVTEEIRLFGLAKKDKFIITGTEKSSIKIRIIGGSGEDKIMNSSPAQVIAYDRPDGMEMEGEHIKSKLADENGINSYDRKDWKQNRSWQFPMITFYTDAGIGVSYNIWKTNFGFRSDPFKSSHRTTMAYFGKNRATLLRYNGLFPNAIGKWDFGVDLFALGPAFTQFYYGKGNNYVDFGERFPSIENSNDQSFHFVEGFRIDFNPTFIRSIGSISRIEINPSLEFIDLKAFDSDSDPRFYQLLNSDVTLENLEAKTYGALGMSFISERLDNVALPSRGYQFDVSTDYKRNFSNSEIDNLSLNTSLKAYIPFDQEKRIVLATNLGASHIFGNIEFFHLNYLAQPTRLRGFRTNRFSGESMVYQASDLRIKVGGGKGAFPVSFGLFGSFDYGRVWFEDDPEDVDGWHTSFGGGIYLTPLDIAGFRIGYFKGGDDFQLTIGGALGF